MLMLWGLFGRGLFGGEFISDSILTETNPGSLSLGFQNFSEVVLPVSLSDSRSLREEEGR